MHRGERGCQPCLMPPTVLLRLTVRPPVKTGLPVLHRVALLAGLVGCTADVAFWTVGIEAHAPHVNGNAPQRFSRNPNGLGRAVAAVGGEVRS